MPWVEADGESLYYVEQGDGAPLVFVSGWAGTSAEWRDDMAWFADRSRCISIEHPGLAGQPAPGSDVSVSAMADRIASGLRALGVDRAAVLGMSMGGAVAQELALRHPELVRGLVLCGTWARMDAHARRALDNCRKLVGEESSCDLETGLSIVYWLVFGRDFFLANTNAMDETLQASLQNPVDARVFEYQARACLGHDSLDRVHAIACPALVTHGEEDAMLHVSHGRRLAEAIPGAQFVPFPRSGHCHVWEDPDLFRASVGTFLDGI